MATTFTLIASSTVGSGGASAITFSSIPNTYTDLQIVCSTRGDTTSGVINVSFNGVTSNLSSKSLYGSGSSAASSSSATAIPLQSDWSTATANTFGNASIYIPNYASSNNKSLSSDAVAENNATEGYDWMNAGLWSNSSAITSITLTSNSSNFVQYSTAYLYGVKNA